MKRTYRFPITVFVIALIPAVAFGQEDRAKHWGVHGSLSPTWKMAPQISKLFEGQVDIKGSELTIGFVRGRDVGGHWGVSFVRKPWKDGSRIFESEDDCFMFNQGSSQICLPFEKSSTFRNTILTGAEVHWFWPFVTIQRRYQIGLNLGVGVGKLSGEIDEQERGFNVTFFNPQTGQYTATPYERAETLPLEESLDHRLFPLLKLEAAGAVVVRRNVKVQIAGGLNFPSSGSFRIAGVYLF